MRRTIILTLVFMQAVAAYSSGQDIEWPPTAADLGLMRGNPASEDKRVTLGNWQYGPYSRWSFQHVREIIPTVSVPRGRTPSRAFAIQETSLSGITFVYNDDSQATVEQMLATTYTDGFLVLHDGAIVSERYFNGLTPDRQHILWSVSKSIAGTLAGVLVHEGELDLTEPVSAYVPELATSGWSDNTIRELLDMRTTSDWIEDYGDAQSSVRRQDASIGFLPMPTEFSGLPRGNYNFLPTIGRNNARDGRFGYKSGDTDVAGWVMEKATGKRLADLLSERIWTRLGAEHEAYYTVDPSGSVLASGGLNATLRDVGRFGQMILDGGRVGNQQVVPDGWIRDIQKNGNREAWQRDQRGGILRHTGGYRSYWWHTADERGTFFAKGIHEQWVYIDPPSRVVLVKLSSYPEASWSEASSMTLAAFEAIARFLDER